MNLYHNGKLVGTLKDGVFRKEVDSRKHKMRMFGGYGIQDSIIQDLLRSGCTEVRIREKDTQTVYSSPFETWLQQAPLQFGHGKQVFLATDRMTQVNTKNGTLFSVDNMVGAHA